MAFSKDSKYVPSEAKFDGIQAVTTSVGTSATQITTPEDAEVVTIYHLDVGESLTVGRTSSVTVGGSDGAVLEYGARLTFSCRTGGDNEIYGIVSTGTITVYAVGQI
jgi:hypothetical protein